MLLQGREAAESISNFSCGFQMRCCSKQVSRVKLCSEMMDYLQYWSALPRIQGPAEKGLAKVNYYSTNWETGYLQRTE